MNAFECSYRLLGETGISRKVLVIIESNEYADILLELSDLHLGIQVDRIIDLNVIRLNRGNHSYQLP